MNLLYQNSQESDKTIEYDLGDMAKDLGVDLTPISEDEIGERNYSPAPPENQDLLSLPRFNIKTKPENQRFWSTIWHRRPWGEWVQIRMPFRGCLDGCKAIYRAYLEDGIKTSLIQVKEGRRWVRAGYLIRDEIEQLLCEVLDRETTVCYKITRYVMNKILRREVTSLKGLHCHHEEYNPHAPNKAWGGATNDLSSNVTPMTPVAHQNHHYVMGDKAFYYYGGCEKSDRENGCNQGLEGLTGVHCIEPYYSKVLNQLMEFRLESLYRVFGERDIGAKTGV